MEEFGKLKKEFEKFGSSTEELLKKADAMLKAVNEHATRERQMNKAINNMSLPAAAASDASGATGGLILEILRALKAHYHFFVVVQFLTCCTDRLAHGVYFHC